MDITGILDTAAKHGSERARIEQQNGATEAREAPLSGEWADDPTPRDVARNAGYFEDDDPEIIDEIASTRLTERGATRADDRASEAAMEDRKREGYF